MATHRRAQTDHYPSHVSGRPDHLIRSRVRRHCRLVEPPLSQKRSGQARDSLSLFSIVNAILWLSSRFDFYRTLSRSMLPTLRVRSRWSGTARPRQQHGKAWHSIASGVLPSLSLTHAVVKGLLCGICPSQRSVCWKLQSAPVRLRLTIARRHVQRVFASKKVGAPGARRGTT